ncbi:MAG: hypothetical protein R3E32_05435 [Chitinophagales bacterium]
MKEKNTLNTSLFLLLFLLNIYALGNYFFSFNASPPTSKPTTKSTESSVTISKAAMGDFNFSTTNYFNPLQLQEEYHSSIFNDNIKVFTLTTDGDEYGQSIWMKRKSGKVKAKYFAYKDLNDDRSVYSKYRSWQGSKDIVLVCSGAYTTESSGNSNMIPAGLTVDNGNVVNRNYRDDMDGLVLVYATGGIVVSDIEEGNLWLQTLERRVDVKESADRTALIAWAKQEEATIFQTHLLAYRNELRIDERGRTERAERRMLVLAIDGEGEVVHILFNIQEEGYLYDIAKNIMNYLNEKKINVVAMLNLDTGWYNILEVYSKNGNKYSDIQGDKPLTKATNLVAYYYED